MSTPVAPRSTADLEGLVGTTLGPTDWHTVDQDRIQAFADVTEDQQWIHVDVERANAGVFGAPIAHGLLTLSLGPRLLADLLSFEGFAHSVNYGYEKVRFPAPLPSGSRVRMSATVVSVDAVQGGAQVTTRCVFEREGSDKPVCVADSVARFLGGADEQ